MAEELTFVLVTPYSLLKSRTGGIIGRLLALSGLDFVGARMYASNDDLVDRFIETIAVEDMPPGLRDALTRELDPSGGRSLSCGRHGPCPSVSTRRSAATTASAYRTAPYAFSSGARTR